MDPLTLLAIGPAVLRTVGKLFGGKTNEVAGKVADVVDAVKGRPNAEEKVRQVLDTLPAEDLIEIKKIALEAEKIRADLKKAELDADTKQQSEAQQTIRAEYQHGNDYVKETRPRIARTSGYATVVYILVAEAARLVTEAWGGALDGASVEVAMMLFAPCGTYMTMRSVDGFSRKGKGG